MFVSVPRLRQLLQNIRRNHKGAVVAGVDAEIKERSSGGFAVDAFEHELQRLHVAFLSQAEQPFGDSFRVRRREDTLEGGS